MTNEATWHVETDSGLLALTEDELGAVLGGDPSGAQVDAPTHAEHIVAFTGAGAALGGGVGFAVGGPPGAAAGMAAGGAAGAAVGVGYEIYEHADSIVAAGGHLVDAAAEYQANPPPI